jgi:hypothetical protein
VDDGRVEPETGPSERLAPVIPARVWISRLGTHQNEMEGTLTLPPTHLKFDHRRDDQHERIPLRAIRKVRRPVGSPVLYVEYATGEEPVRLAFFFAQPPPVDVEGVQFRARRRRSDNAGFMWHQSGNVAALVKQWRAEIREAMREARRG